MCLKRVLWGGKPGGIKPSLCCFFLLMALIVSWGIHCNHFSLWISFLSSQCLVLWIYPCMTQSGGVGCTSLLEIFLKQRSSIQHFKIERIKDERNACIFASTTYLHCFTERLPCCFLIFLCWIFDKWCSAWKRLELQFRGLHVAGEGPSVADGYLSGHWVRESPLSPQGAKTFRVF